MLRATAIDLSVSRGCVRSWNGQASFTRRLSCVRVRLWLSDLFHIGCLCPRSAPTCPAVWPRCSGCCTGWSAQLSLLF